MAATLRVVPLFLGLGLPAVAVAEVVRFETPLGSFDVELFEEDAPQTVENFLNYVEDGDYERSFIHRSVVDFVIQGGGFTFIDGRAENVPTDPPVQNEFNQSNLRGTIAMAKVGGNPDSATSQWFINLADNSENLDDQNGGFTVFGRVLGDGMDVVDAIAALPRWNLGGAFNTMPLIDYPGSGTVVDENIVFTDITLLDPAATDIDVTGVIDISADAVPDIAYLTSNDQPRVNYYSGADGQQIKSVKYFGGAWQGVAAATVADSNGNGVAKDPSVAALATRDTGKHSVEIRRSRNGKLLDRIEFLDPGWQALDVAVIDDGNGDGVVGDTIIAVLGFDPDGAFNEKIRVQAKQLSDGAVVGDWFFLNGAWTPIALEGVNFSGQSPLVALLANKKATGENVVRARKLSNGKAQTRMPFLDTNWLARDLTVLKDANGDGNANDPAYVVLGNHKMNNRNKVQARRISNAKGLKQITFLGASWEVRRVAGTGDISGNLIEEVGALANKRADGQATIQVKDFGNKSVTLRINP